MLEIKDLDFGKIGDRKELTLTEELILDDPGFSNKPVQIAKVGETVKLFHGQNYGLVSHPIYGNFRY